MSLGRTIDVFACLARHSEQFEIQNSVPLRVVYGIGDSSICGRTITLIAHLRLRHWIVGAGALVCLFAPNISFGTESQEMAYESPPHFKGWILIQYEDPACAALPSGTASILVSIPESGCACTSDALPLGFRLRRLERVHPDGTREVIPFRFHDDSSEVWNWGTGMGPSRSIRKTLLREAFFVGSKKEFLSQYKLNPVGPQFPEQKICTELDDHARLK